MNQQQPQQDPSSLRRSMRLQARQTTQDDNSQTRPIVPHPSINYMSMSSDRSCHSHLTPSNSTHLHTVHSRLQPPSVVPPPLNHVQPVLQQQGEQEPHMLLPSPIMNGPPSVHTVLLNQTNMPAASTSNFTETTLFLPLKQVISLDTHHMVLIWLHLI